VSGTPKVVCIGPVTAREARGYGFVVAAVARPHTIEGVVAALERALAPRPRSSSRGGARRAGA
jgi:uroporphyrinogen-III synthase